MLNINELTEEEIMRVIEDNLQAFCSSVVQIAGKSLFVGPDFSWVNTFPSSWPNFIFNAKFHPEEASGRVAEIIRQNYATPKMPLEWLVGPGTAPGNLGMILEKHYFQKVYSVSGMAVDLRNLAPITLPGLKIKTLESKSLLSKWVSIVAVDLFGGEVEENLFVNVLKSPEFKFYIAELDGEEVATSMGFLHNGVVGVHLVATLPAYRRRGIGTMMSLAPLLEARGKGFLTGVLHASEMGKSVYDKLGFKEYCTFNMYHYMPQDEA